MAGTSPAAGFSPIRRFFLLTSVAVCAASGLIYELALISLSTNLNGGGVVETSLIVAGFVASLGLGALAAKPLLRHAETSFLIVEAVLGLVGGVSATVLYVVFAHFGQSLWALVVATLVIGMLVGSELPMLMTMFQRGRIVDARTSGSILATLNAADYLGAVLGGLAWPFVLLPTLGLLQGTAAAGLMNIAAALVIGLVVLRKDMQRGHLIAAVATLLIAATALIVVVIKTDRIVTTARQALYSDPVIFEKQSKYQDIVVTQRGHDRRLFLNGGLQYSTRDEYRYTESLVYPVISDATQRVLIIGGGDGLAARELLRMPQIESITQVELDPEVIDVANTVLRDDNGGSMDDPKVKLLTKDAFTWIRRGGEGTQYDSIIVDLPDPNNDTMARLYSEEFYAMLRGALSPGGRMVVQSSSAFSTPDVFYRVSNTLKSAGCPDVVPYHVHVPTFGDWGFNLCGPKGTKVEVPRMAPPLKYASNDVLAAATVFGGDNEFRRLAPNTLDHPRIVEDLRRGYRQSGE